MPSSAPLPGIRGGSRSSILVISSGLQLVLQAAVGDGLLYDPASAVLFEQLGLSNGLEGAGGISWKTGGRAMPLARQIGSMVGPGAGSQRLCRGLVIATGELSHSPDPKSMTTASSRDQ